VQIHRAGYRVKGFYRLADYALRWGMVHKDAAVRLKIIRFFERHGLAATLEAFDVSRRTLYNWKASLQAEGGNVSALVPGSTVPQNRRYRSWPAAVVGEIKRLRRAHPNLGKEKVHALLKPWCMKHSVECPSARTIGRLIADAPDKMRHAPQRIGYDGRPKRPRSAAKARKPKGFSAVFPGHCVALDTIERHRDGLTRYLITLTDTHSRFAFALASTRRNSQVAQATLQLAQTVFPVPCTAILTDNGGEFAKHFADHVRESKITHWHTYPRTPKMNAHVERFNRTLQEEFVDFHEELLLTDIMAFNDKLFDYLTWYNLHRPHHALQLQSPMQVIANYLNSNQCNMLWPNTIG
jgi:transposase InsO family protein